MREHCRIPTLRITESRFWESDREHCWRHSRNWIEIILKIIGLMDQDRFHVENPSREKVLDHSWPARKKDLSQLYSESLSNGISSFIRRFTAYERHPGRDPENHLM